MSGMDIPRYLLQSSSRTPVQANRRTPTRTRAIFMTFLIFRRPS